MFTGRKYGLDYYQREYSWSKIHVRELLDDLSNSFNKGIIVREYPKNGTILFWRV